MKSCSPHQIRSPASGRCIKKCSPSYERNPQTKRCVKKCKSPYIRSPRTKRCIKNLSITKPNCSPTQILNPFTNRCVKRDNTIGTWLSVDSSSSDVEESVNEMTQNDIETYLTAKSFSGANTKRQPTVITQKSKSKSTPIVASDTIYVKGQTLPLKIQPEDVVKQSILKISEERLGFKPKHDLQNELKEPGCDMQVVRISGQGGNAFTFIAKRNNQVILLKLMTMTPTSNDLKDFEEEYEKQTLFYQKKIFAPKPLFYGTTSEFLFSAMEINTYAVEVGMFRNILATVTLANYKDQWKQAIQKCLFAFFKAFETNKVMHGDLNWANMGIVFTKEKMTDSIQQMGEGYLSPFLIDFRDSKVLKQPLYDIDVYQLIRSLYYYNDISKEIKSDLFDFVIKTFLSKCSYITRDWFPTVPTWSQEEFEKYKFLTNYEQILPNVLSTYFV